MPELDFELIARVAVGVGLYVVANVVIFKLDPDLLDTLPGSFAAAMLIASHIAGGLLLLFWVFGAFGS